MMISYAQNFEDVLLERAFHDVAEGFYVDIGAADPSYCSVTKHLYDRGWSGVNVEPTSVFHALATARRRDINLQIAVGAEDGWTEFVENISFPECSGEAVPPALGPCETRRFRVPQRRLSTLLDRHAQGRTIHFLKLDVEGVEESVISSGDWKKHRPLIVIVEATFPLTQRPSHQSWEATLLGNNYLFAWFDGVNRWYVRAENRELLENFQTPVNVFDMFTTQQQATSTGSDRAEEREAALAREVASLRAQTEIQSQELAERALAIRELSRRLVERERHPMGVPGHWSAVVGNCVTSILKFLPPRERLDEQPHTDPHKPIFLEMLEQELNVLPALLNQQRPPKENVRIAVTKIRSLTGHARAYQLVSGFPVGRQVEHLAEGLARLGR